jgi:hypothetical protein
MPCERQTVNEMMSFPPAQAALTSLRNSVQSGANHEIGYPIYENSTGGLLFGDPIVGTAGSPEVLIEYNPEPEHSPNGFFHSHYNGTEYTFSADDVYNFILLSANTGNNNTTPDLAGLVNPNGTAYTIVIENPDSLANFLLGDWDNNRDTPNTYVTLEQFSARYDLGTAISNLMYPGNPEKAGELKLLSFLNGMGVSLYRAGYNVTTNGYENFSKLEKSADGKSVQPCN